MQRYSIRGLMAFIVASAVGLAALRRADELWAIIMLLIALIAVDVAVLGAVLTRGRERAWWIGFAVSSGGYVIASLSPAGPDIFTTHALRYLHSQVSVVPQSQRPARWMVRTIKRPQGDVRLSAANPAAPDAAAGGPPVNRWRTLLRPSDLGTFQRIGHCLFALAAGLLGGVLGVWFWRRRELSGTAGVAGGPSA
jgi:hypothetical protein